MVVVDGVEFHQATIGGYHPSKNYDFMIMDILMYQGCNKCLPGWFPKSPASGKLLFSSVT